VKAVSRSGHIGKCMVPSPYLPSALHPAQVVALQGGAAMRALNPDCGGMADAMVSRSKTDASQTFCRQIELADRDASVAAALHFRAT